MKKKVIVLILALFMLMPVSGVFASDEWHFSDGLFDKYPNLIDESSKETPKALDNRLNTYESTGFNIYFKDVLPVIEGYYIHGERMGYLKIDTENGEAYSEYINNFNGYIKFDEPIKNVTRITLTGFPIDYIKLIQFEIFGSVQAVVKNVSNIQWESTHDSLFLSWDEVEQENILSYEVYYEDKKIETNQNKLTINELNYNTEYEIIIKTVNNEGEKSSGSSVITKTKNIESSSLKEIKDVNAEASHDRVDLSWSLPETEYFEHVNIYRKKVSDVQTFNLLSTDAYDPLFETNGTYFNDLTVEEQTTYDYKLTTEFQGIESQGVTVQATTLVAPPPELGGQEFEELENGDYLVTWQQPETGQVRILVDGQEYVVVPATDKQYTIPAADMKYSSLGDPLVGLQTIGDNGEESEVEQQESNVNLPFGINELLTTSAGLLRVVGSLILLGLSFILVPKFIKLIKQSLNNKKNAETERTEREQRVSDRAYREPRATRISTREGRTSTRVTREYRKGE